MKRLAVASAAAFLCSLLFAPAALAQTKQAPAAKAAPAAATPAPAAPAKWSRPVKGTAYVEVIKGTPKRIGADMVTVLKIRNISQGAINLLKVDEYWYDRKTKIVSGDSVPYRKPFNPGEIIEITTKSPVKPDLYQNQFAFSHANGDVKVTAVKKFQ